MRKRIPTFKRLGGSTQGFPLIFGWSSTKTSSRAHGGGIRRPGQQIISLRACFTIQVSRFIRLKKWTMRPRLLSSGSPRKPEAGLAPNNVPTSDPGHGYGFMRDTRSFPISLGRHTEHIGDDTRNSLNICSNVRPSSPSVLSPD